MTDMEWKNDALCARVGSPDQWFSTGNGHDSRLAEKRTALICVGCRVKDACLSYALENREEWGIWGGMTTTQRNSLLRKQRRHAAA